MYHIVKLVMQYFVVWVREAKTKTTAMRTLLHWCNYIQMIKVSKRIIIKVFPMVHLRNTFKELRSN